jgi:hypothetical protein
MSSRETERKLYRCMNEYRSENNLELDKGTEY